MSDDDTNGLWQAMLRNVMDRSANGSPIIDTPDWCASGPCPHCLHRIDPSVFAFRSGATTNKKAKNIGVVVCGGCRTAVIWTEAGKYRPMSRAIRRSLPKETREFIARNQALIADLKRHIN